MSFLLFSVSEMSQTGRVFYKTWSGFVSGQSVTPFFLRHSRFPKRSSVRRTTVGTGAVQQKAPVKASRYRAKYSVCNFGPSGGFGDFFFGCFMFKTVSHSFARDIWYRDSAPDHFFCVIWTLVVMTTDCYIWIILWFEKKISRPLGIANRVSKSPFISGGGKNGRFNDLKLRDVWFQKNHSDPPAKRWFSGWFLWEQVWDMYSWPGKMNFSPVTKWGIFSRDS